MKNLILTLAVLFSAVVFSCGQSRNVPVNLTLHGGMNWYTGDLGSTLFDFNTKYTDNNVTAGASFGYYLNKSFDLLIMGNYGSVSYFTGNTRMFKSTMTNGNINLKYKFGVADNAFVKPYIYLGTGIIFHSNQGREPATVTGVEWMPVSAGAGVNFQASERVQIQFQLAYMYWGTDDRDLLNKGQFNDAHIMPTIGVGFNIGKIADEDNDGVADEFDKCANTPSIAKVDKNGCPLDTDGDGLEDYRDNCPYENGNVVTAKGCPDADKDGVPDAEDHCPNLAGLANLNGCPDSDGDGIIDSKDKCPEIKGDPEFQGCPDTDNDGVPDPEDLCPDVKGVKLFSGCPDTDNDGIEDKNDQCPYEKGLPETNGCPDSDNDGVIDKNDDCPDVKGGAATKGCPDSDGDGIPDRIDKCINTPGLATNNGCPEVPKEVKLLFQKALQGIQFETGKAVIKPVSFPILNSVVNVMNENPTYKLTIEGHTDNVGDDHVNLTLSQNRAEAVQKYLITKGISPMRTNAVGFGEQEPVDTNKTASGRARNRRVELKIDYIEVIKTVDPVGK